MEIRSTISNRSGKSFNVVYRDIDSLDEIGERVVNDVHAFCFHKGKLVIVYDTKRQRWTPPGGGVEKGESIEEAVAREVKEESNMRVVRQHLIGFQDISEPTRTVTQTRSVCIVEPLGDFITDPDGDITEIKLIDPKDYKKYFDWGIVGERVMERALSLAVLIQAS